MNEADDFLIIEADDFQYLPLHYKYITKVDFIQKRGKPEFEGVGVKFYGLQKRYYVRGPHKPISRIVNIDIFPNHK
ncbi:MAG: hypothetical protein ACKV1O_30635 [Saprospiraceae bacterium]